MAVNENGGNGVRIFSPESFLDHQARFFFVFAFDLNLCHFSSAGNLAIEIIAMCGAERDDAATSLRKARCPAAVSVHDTANLSKCFIKFEVSRRVGGRF